MSARLVALRHKHKAAVAKMREISTAAGDGLMTEEQETAFKAAKAEVGQLVTAIDAEQATIAEEQREAAALHAAAPPAPDRVPVVVSQEDPPKFKNIGEYLGAVKAAYEHGTIDNRLVGAAGASEGVAPDGGFLVGTDIATQIVEPLYDTGGVYARCTPFPISGTSNGIKIPAVDETSRATGSRWGGVKGYWLAEGAPLTDSKTKFSMVEFNLKKAGVLAYATDELLSDAPAYSPFLMRAMQGELQFTVEDSLINGDGVGKCLGIQTAPALVSQAIEGTQTIANSNQFIALNTLKMISRLPARSYLNSTWLANIELLPTLATATVSGTAGTVPVYVGPTGMKEAPFGTVWGRPVLFVEYCPAPGTPGDLILADLAMYGVATKGAAQIAESMHVKFLTDEMTFRVIIRLDGAPLWKSPLTPFKGNLSRSPFVNLAVRA